MNTTAQLNALSTEPEIKTIHLTESELWNLLRAAIKDGFEYSAEGHNGEYMGTLGVKEFDSDLDHYTNEFCAALRKNGDIP